MKRTAIELIAEERQRQIDQERFSFEHDDKYTHDELTRAAMCYCMDADNRKSINEDGEDIFESGFWPFEKYWFKPTPDNRIRELQKAGALIAAEIERLQRREGELDF